MKNRHVVLSEWYSLPPIAENGVAIDWPWLHRELGEDCVEWLIEQEQKGNAQLSIEQQTAARARLICEFFSERSHTVYNMNYAHLLACVQHDASRWLNSL